MVGCCIRACFARCSLSPAFIIASGESLLPAVAPFCCPLPATVLVLSLLAARLCCSSVNGWLLSPCLLGHPPFVPSSASCSHHLLPLCKHQRFCRWPLPPFAAHCQPQSSCSCCQPLLAFAAFPSMVGCCILCCFSFSAHFCHGPLVYIIDALVTNTE